jgi:hypothetical protein
VSSQFTPKFAARQEGGKLIVADGYRFKKCLETFGDNPLDLIIRIHREQRTTPQNKYYMKVVVGMIAGHTGQNDGAIHEILKRKFLTRTIEIAPGVFEEETGSTTELDTVSFPEYWDKCREWALDFLKLNIPEPEQVEVNA